MRVLRDHQDRACAEALRGCPPTTVHRSIRLEDVGKLWAEWGIHVLILVSFGLQVFLFFAAGLRRRSASRILRSLLWLAYLSADNVAIFILGHLSVHASGPRHQLLFLWAPFVLLHLGGQHTITAFSMQDNELWRRHLLGLVNQVVVAAYVVSMSPWPDRRLLAAMVLMFISGCLRYAERTLCLYNASTAKLTESSLVALRDYAKELEDGDNKDREYHGFIPKEYVVQTAEACSRDYELIIDNMFKADGRQLSFDLLPDISSSAAALVSATPLSNLAAAEASPNRIQRKLKQLKSSAHRCRTYNYVGTQLIHIYEHLYTKAPAHSIFLDKVIKYCDIGKLLFFIIPTRWFDYCCVPILFISLISIILASFLLALFPFLSTLGTLVLFVVAKKSQLYSQADVIVSYILLIGAITLEASSLFITFALSEQAPHRIQSAVWRVGKYVYPAWGTKQWSEMLWQYNMINSVTKQDDAGIMSLVPQWISKHLYDKTITHIDIYENLKKSVLDKLLEFGTRKEDWNFASFRGQLALRGRKSNHGPLSFLLPAKPETPLLKSINDVDFPTTVLIWHIATDILFFQDNSASNTSSYPQMKMSKEISNYVMYLVFKCGVMITNTTELQHDNALKVMEANRGLGAEGAINKVFQANKLLKRTSKSHVQPLLPHACKVAQELIDIPGEANRWDLITAVWLEMLFYIAPRCGGSFHSEHLATGGEFITHVLLLMHFLGPFLKPQGIELLCAK